MPYLIWPSFKCIFSLLCLLYSFMMESHRAWSHSPLCCKLLQHVRVPAKTTLKPYDLYLTARGSRSTCNCSHSKNDTKEKERKGVVDPRRWCMVCEQRVAHSLDLCSRLFYLQGINMFNRAHKKQQDSRHDGVCL